MCRCLSRNSGLLPMSTVGFRRYCPTGMKSTRTGVWVVTLYRLWLGGCWTTASAQCWFGCWRTIAARAGSTSRWEVSGSVEGPSRSEAQTSKRCPTVGGTSPASSSGRKHSAVMVDRLFSEPSLAESNDAFCGGRRDFGFYLPLVMSARSVLDVGCGTGEFLHLAREAGHTGRLCGLDPAVAMLGQARKRPDTEWVPGDLASVDWCREFDLEVRLGSLA